MNSEFVNLLAEVERLYEHIQEISSTTHKQNNFSIAIFGSARLQQSSPEFRFIADLTQTIVRKTHADIVTGGGPGIMEAANQGIIQALNEQQDNFVKDKTPKSYGLRVSLPFEENANDYLHINKSHQYFTTRLQSFVNLIQGAYVSAGGLGSLMEFTLLWQLKQVGHLPADFPLVLSSVWKPVVDSFYNMTVYSREDATLLIDSNDTDFLQFSDIPEEIVEIFYQASQKWKINKDD